MSQIDQSVQENAEAARLLQSLRDWYASGNQEHPVERAHREWVLAVEARLAVLLRTPSDAKPQARPLDANTYAMELAAARLQGHRAELEALASAFAVNVPDLEVINDARDELVASISTDLLTKAKADGSDFVQGVEREMRCPPYTAKREPIAQAAWVPGEQAIEREQVAAELHESRARVREMEDRVARRDARIAVLAGANDARVLAARDARVRELEAEVERLKSANAKAHADVITALDKAWGLTP